MRCLSVTGPWSDEDRQQREDAGRPCVHLDQTNQFIHQYCGNLRKNKRAIQCTPKGNGANEADAGRRSNVIRSIEEQSNAPTAVYIPAAESAAMRSYGFAVIRTEYKPGATFDQTILLKPVPNPDCVLLNPYFKQPNACDIEDAFLLDSITKKKFRELYGKQAKITNFEGEEVTGVGVSDWIKEHYVVRAEYWKLHQQLRTLLLIRRGPNGLPEIAWEDELENRDKGGRFKNVRNGIEVLREREVSTPYVVQYMTNGLEILDEIDWAGTRIPIISCLGPQRWRIQGGKPVREILSLTRFARDPQMLFDFLATQECEEAGMVPKVPFVGAKGQFESDQEAWDELNHQPHPYVQYDPIVDATGDNVLPPPTRPQYVANFQQYELAKDSAGRSLQASMGISPLPNAAQRANQKSGLALEKIQDEEDIGTYQFVDLFENGFLHNMGWQVNELITPILDTQQEIPVTTADGKHSTLHIVGRTSHPVDERGTYEVQDLPEEHLHTARGEFDVTISSGPSKASEQEAQADFVDRLLENLANLPQPGTPQAKVFALAVRMRPDLGPIGKQIADIFDPPDASNLPPEAQAAIANLQAQLQALTQENSTLHMERAGKVLELQNKQTIESMKGRHKLDEKTMELITKIITAQLAKGSKASEQQAAFDADRELAMLGFTQEHIDRAHQAAHELGMLAMEHQHQRDTAAQMAAATANQPGEEEPAQVS